MPVFVADSGEEFETENKNEIQFIEDMENAGIPWRTYSGRFMYGRKCPAVSSSEDITEHEIYRATKVHMKYDSLGLNKIFYTG